MVRALLLLLQVAVVRAEIISDVSFVVRASAADESRALELKAEAFWQAILSSAEDIKLVEHANLLEQVDKVVAELPKENVFVRETLATAAERLRRADATMLARAVESSGVASAKLSAPAGSTEGGSFFSGGSNFLKQAIQRFVTGGQYTERLTGHVEQRQADILPMLQGVASSTGNVLKDVKEASKLSFDVLKYDIYNKGVPKTPQAAKDIAYKLVDASGETRHRFMSFITQTVSSIGRDAQDKKEDASATVAQASFKAAEARAEAFVPEEILNL